MNTTLDSAAAAATATAADIAAQRLNAGCHADVIDNTGISHSVPNAVSPCLLARKRFYSKPRRRQHSHHYTDHTDLWHFVLLRYICLYSQ